MENAAVGESNVPKLRHCAYCLKESPDTKSCSSCKRRTYCSKECQRQDWLPTLSGQGHKLWCKLNCGEEDLDWKVVEVPNKGLGVIALRDFPGTYKVYNTVVSISVLPIPRSIYFFVISLV